MNPSRRGAVAFLRYCQNSDWNPDPIEVRVFIQERQVDPNYSFFFLHDNTTFLHEFARRGLLQCIQEYMETPFAIDFTINNSWLKYTVLHVLCDYRIPNDVARGMLESILFRIQTHPNDVVDWGLRARNGFDFLSHAAYQERLSLFWPLVRDMPYFADQVEPIDLCSWIWEWDLLTLYEQENNLEFKESPKIVKANRSTVSLIRLCLEKDWNMEGNSVFEEVQQYIAEGADVNFRGPGRECSILHEFISRGNVVYAKLCLTSDHPIAFTAQNSKGKSILDSLCTTTLFFVENRENRPEAAAELLQLIIEHASTNFNFRDTLDWSKTKKIPNRGEVSFGEKFLDTVVQNGKLSLFWPVLQAFVPFYGHRKTFILTSSVQEEDWSKLSEKNQKHFLLKGGIR